jgi:hypothetical protein
MFTTDKPSILAMPRLALGLWLVAFAVVCTLLVWAVAPAEWGWLQIGFGGPLLGAMSFYMLFINRLLVS